MIEVRLRYYETNNELFSDRERIGFWTWEQFVQWFNRLYRWRIKFELEEINGSDYYTNRGYIETPIFITAKGVKPIATGPLYLMQGATRPEYNATELIILLNDRIRNDYP